VIPQPKTFANFPVLLSLSLVVFALRHTAILSFSSPQWSSSRGDAQSLSATCLYLLLTPVVVRRGFLRLAQSNLSLWTRAPVVFICYTFGTGHPPLAVPGRPIFVAHVG